VAKVMVKAKEVKAKEVKGKEAKAKAIAKEKGIIRIYLIY